MKNIIFFLFSCFHILIAHNTHFLSKSMTGQSCAATLVCGDGYCCKYSAACICSVEPCRELCMHGDVISPPKPAPAGKISS